MRAVISGIVLAAWLLVSSLASAESGKPLTNQDVIDMVTAGLPESTILLAIKQSAAGFATSPQDLIALKKAGVSAKIMDAMIAKDATLAPTKPMPSSASQSENEQLPVSYGFYLIAHGKLSKPSSTAVDRVFGLRLADRGRAVDGFRPSSNAVVVDDPNVQFIVYAHEADPRAYKFARLELVSSMQTGQFAPKTDPQHFRNVFGVSAYEQVTVNLLRQKEQISLRIEPVVGRDDMYRLVPVQPLTEGQSYALYEQSHLHDGNIVFAASINDEPTYGILIATHRALAKSSGATQRVGKAGPPKNQEYLNCISMNNALTYCEYKYPDAPSEAASIEAVDATSGRIAGRWQGELKVVGWGPAQCGMVLSVNRVAPGETAGTQVTTQRSRPYMTMRMLFAGEEGGTYKFKWQPPATCQNGYSSCSECTFAEIALSAIDKPVATVKAKLASGLEFAGTMQRTQ